MGKRRTYSGRSREACRRLYGLRTHKGEGMKGREEGGGKECKCEWGKEGMERGRTEKIKAGGRVGGALVGGKGGEGVRGRMQGEEGSRREGDG